MTALPIAFPTAIPSSNSHRVVVFQPDLRGTDLERVEDLAADAIAAAREAFAAFETLPHDAIRPLRHAERMLREAVDRRRVLTEEFRHAAADILRDVVRLNCAKADEACRDTVLRRLRDALERSHRVADLLAAEEQIGRLRGLGR